MVAGLIKVVLDLDITKVVPTLRCQCCQEAVQLIDPMELEFVDFVEDRIRCKFIVYLSTGEEQARVRQEAGSSHRVPEFVGFTLRLITYLNLIRPDCLCFQHRILVDGQTNLQGKGEERE